MKLKDQKSFYQQNVNFQPSQKESYIKQILLENKQKQSKMSQDSFGITGVQFGRKIPVSGVMTA